jgi:hypothetical protein
VSQRLTAAHDQWEICGQPVHELWCASIMRKRIHTTLSPSFDRFNCQSAVESPIQDAVVESTLPLPFCERCAMTQIVKEMPGALPALSHAPGPKTQKRKKNGSGAEGNRTLYLLHAMQTLSQMSYGPCLQLGT